MSRVRWLYVLTLRWADGTTTRHRYTTRGEAEEHAATVEPNLELVSATITKTRAQ